MNRLHSNYPSTRRTQTGFSMIEVLVTLLIITLALLGTAGLQAYSMRLNQGGQFRTQAVFLVADLAERMEANKTSVLNGDYEVTTSNTPGPLSTACISAVCTPSALADYDLSQWQNAVVAALPQSSWTVAQTVVGSTVTYTITLNWVDRKSDTTTAAYDASSTAGANATGTGERFSYVATRTFFN